MKRLFCQSIFVLGMMFFTFGNTTVATEMLGPKGEIQVGTNPDGSQCFYCGPHEHLGCDTPGNACNKPVE